MKTVLVLVFLFCSPFVSAQTSEFPETSGNAFVRLCSAVEKDDNTQLESAHSIGCLGYVAGFVDGVNLQTSFAEHKTNQKVPKPFCRPESVEHGQLVSIVLKYIRNHPEDAHLPTGILIIPALGKAYPCPSK
jgi:hypothetical protein